MEIKNSPLLARDSGACVPSSLRQQKKGVHGRAWVLDMHIAHQHTYKPHTHIQHTHMHAYAHIHTIHAE